MLSSLLRNKQVRHRLSGIQCLGNSHNMERKCNRLSTQLPSHKLCHSYLLQQAYKQWEHLLAIWRPEGKHLTFRQ
jgi:hypothetical protein